MRPVALAAYLIFSRRARWVGKRILTRRLKDGRERPERIQERRGLPTADREEGELIWLHAGTVAEALSTQELIRRLLEEDDSLNFLVTTQTGASAAAIENRLPHSAIHQYLPLDFELYVRRFLDHWKPDIAVWTQSELWPAMITESRKRKIPLILLNGRMSKRSFNRWRYVYRSARELVDAFRTIHAVDENSADYFQRLGAKQDNVRVTGLLKEGSPTLAHNEEERAEFVRMVGRRAVWLAASTHPGEEEIVARAHREVLRRAPRTLLIVVPRHAERGVAIAKDYREHGWRVAVRSLGEALQPDSEIYIADTMGELGLWYRVAPVSFVGGSIAAGSGHNPFEPAALGSAILNGPNVSSYRDIYDRLATAGASRIVRRPDDLANEVINLLAPDQVALMAHAAWEVCSSGAEVTDLALEAVLENIGVVG